MSHQQPNQIPTPEQVYQKFNQNELNSRQMFELLYNSYIELESKFKRVEGENAQLIEQLNQFTKQKDSPQPKPKGKK